MYNYILIGNILSIQKSDENGVSNMKYLTLLRGINVGGNNKVPMAELKSIFSNAGYSNVHTYINSGNLFVSSDLDTLQVAAETEKLLKINYQFPIDFRVLSQDEFMTDVQEAPDWWGKDPELRHNALFKLKSYEDQWDDWLLSKLSDFEQVDIHQNIIFWTSTLKKNYSKSFYSKILGTPFYKQTSARNFNTTTKLTTLF